MAIDWQVLGIPKPLPRLVTKMARRRTLAVEEAVCRLRVDRRDRRVCFYPKCRAFASEKHHITPRSVRGKTTWDTRDILSACPVHHAFFKAGLISVSGNPDRGSVKTHLTALGRKAGVRIPR